MIDFNLLYSPTGLLPFWIAIILSFALGLIHGVTPDEHTWPIVLSYSIGSYSAKGGFKTGVIFSLGFTLQRALLTEIAYLALASFLLNEYVNGVVYIAVGIAMYVVGIYILNRGKYIHTHILEIYMHIACYRHKDCEFNNRIKALEEHKKEAEPKPVSTYMAAVHGIIAGFGFGPFALILVTVLAPSMPNYILAFLPGMLFGLGTMTMQIIFGMIVGLWLEKRKYTQDDIKYLGRKTSGRILYYGGLAFIIAGVLLIALPSLNNYALSTGIKVLNLDYLGIGFWLVIFLLIAIAVPSYIVALKEVKDRKRHIEKL